MNLGWISAVASVLCVIGANLSLKAGADRIERAASLEGSRAYLEPMVGLGVVLYVVSLAAWIVALRRLELSQVYPLMGAAIVTVTLVGARMFGETLTPLRLSGAVLVALGIVLVVLSPSR
jgi:drug/metabolite transporter (DMT)-like permease